MRLQVRSLSTWDALEPRVLAKSKERTFVQEKRMENFTLFLQQFYTAISLKLLAHWNNRRDNLGKIQLSDTYGRTSWKYYKIKTISQYTYTFEVDQEISRKWNADEKLSQIMIWCAFQLKGDKLQVSTGIFYKSLHTDNWMLKKHWQSSLPIFTPWHTSQHNPEKSLKVIIIWTLRHVIMLKPTFQFWQLIYNFWIIYFKCNALLLITF